ncbi:MAG TPA: GIY-YIG nuclease family protein [Thiotrichales bacterium]|nr:GIY-YIG nuclease family protein [Thiotrichales bacterium]
MSAPQGAITYQLLLEVTRPATVTVGRLGRFTLPPGRYFYTGSARRNLEARIARHLKRRKKRRWHIDWLTTHPAIRVVEVIRSTLPECELNQRTGGEIPIPGFGASDCRAGCGSHLRRIGPLPASRRSARE